MGKTFKDQAKWDRKRMKFPRVPPITKRNSVHADKREQKADALQDWRDEQQHSAEELAAWDRELDDDLREDDDG